MMKEKSAFIRFQAMQAVAFDVAFFIVYMSGVVLSGLIMVVMAVALLVVAFSFSWFLARVIATISVAQGQDFRYPWLGARVERSLAGHPAG